GLAGYFQLALWGSKHLTWAEMALSDNIAVLLNLAILVSSGLVLLFADDYLRARNIRYGEFYPLLLFATAGAMIMLSSTNLMVIFLGLEVLSLALYVLTGLARAEARSEEAALKYFLLGAFASAFFLYGIALLYGAQGSVDMRDLGARWVASAPGEMTRALLTASLALMLVGLGFKAALAPFHLWTPDVYQGAPTVATAYMAAVSKVAAFGVLLRLLSAATPMLALWSPILWTLALLSMLVGNLAALVQRDAKRMLAYSSVGHAGYLAVGLVSMNATGQTGVLFYLVAYALMTVGAFGVLAMMTRAGDATTVDALQGLARRQPFAAFAMAILMFSLAGIPPTAGFWGKWYLFLGALEGGQIPLAIVLALTSVVGAAYYLRLTFSLYSEPAEAPVSRWRVPAPMVVCLLACLIGLVGLGIGPRPLAESSRQAVVQAGQVGQIGQR
ncbi:MAG: NADH-quinone oxidoreductase subunit N, partial [Fimbriimonadales bacterium]|nr:NADH-quinone oxidoreductase subunit N [Fimbriimonadales bacterium]